MLSSHKSVKWAVTAIAVLAAMMLTSAAAQADIINVPGDAPTIQAGIDMAVNGDEVVVADGVYTGKGNRDLDFNGKLITVRSENGPANCIIDCEGSSSDPHRGFYFHSGETAEARVEGVTITSGSAGIAGGGGMLCAGSSPTVTDCIFSGNMAEALTSFDWGGGGMLCKWGGNPTVTDCIFIGNTVSSEVGLGHGGGMSSVVASPTLTNCTFTGNNADRGGGIYSEDSSAMLTNCTFSQNTAAGDGGGMYNTNSNPTLTNCTFSQNTAYKGGGMRNESSSPAVTNCTFSGNEAVAGGGVYNHLGRPALTDCTFSGNVAENAGGGVYQGTTSVEGSPTFTKCAVVANVAGSIGGGMYTGGFFFPPVLANCVFALNRSAEGGGMYAYWSSTSIGATVTNCLFIQNLATTNGDGLYTNTNSPTVTNCTFWGNVSSGLGGGIYATASYGGSEVFVSNCILWGNSPNSMSSVPLSETTVNYSDVQGGWPGAGSNNIDADPLFVDADGPDNVPGTEDDNLRLSPGSPCIDAADNTAVSPDTADLDNDGDTAEPIPFDLDGNPRFVDDPDTPDTGNPDGINPLVDMGAYEFQLACPWDLDGNGTVGILDLLALLAAWGSDPGGPPDFDGDFTVDILDLLTLLANWGPCP